MESKIKACIRDIPDFPIPGIVFKDITPILANPKLCREIVEEMAIKTAPLRPDAIAGVESRGFLFGPALASALGIPFVPIRKAGKLPWNTFSYKYQLEYGTAEMEMHTDAIRPGWNVVIHDDLLATGGTAAAAAELIKMGGGSVSAFLFLVNLTFLSGNGKISGYSDQMISLVDY